MKTNLAKVYASVSARNVVLLSLVAEGAIALAALLAPSLLARLILGSDVVGAGAAYGRLLGVSLLSLVIACWPGPRALEARALRAVLAYNLLVALYLAYLGLAESPVGVMLWPAVAEHAFLALLLALEHRNPRAMTAARST